MTELLATYLDLTNPTLDFVEIAHGMGVAGKRITHPEEIQRAVTEALEMDAPYVLEVVTDGRVPAQ
jgi:thiamine pyrophosphate-dependent acetolactate synthase large subunit-like protein